MVLAAIALTFHFAVKAGPGGGHAGPHPGGWPGAGRALPPGPRAHLPRPLGRPDADRLPEHPVPGGHRVGRHLRVGPRGQPSQVGLPPVRPLRLHLRHHRRGAGPRRLDGGVGCCAASIALRIACSNRPLRCCGHGVTAWFCVQAFVNIDCSRAPINRVPLPSHAGGSSVSHGRRRRAVGGPHARSHLRPVPRAPTMTPALGPHSPAARPPRRCGHRSRPARHRHPKGPGRPWPQASPASWSAATGISPVGTRPARVPSFPDVASAQGELSERQFAGVAAGAFRVPSAARHTASPFACRWGLRGAGACAGRRGRRVDRGVRANAARRRHRLVSRSHRCAVSFPDTPLPRAVVTAPRPTHVLASTATATQPVPDEARIDPGRRLV